MIVAGELPNPLQSVRQAKAERQASAPGKRVGPSHHIVDAPPVDPPTIILLDGIEYFRLLNELPR